MTISTAMKKTSLSSSSRRRPHLWRLLVSTTISLLLISRSSSDETESLVFVRCSQSRYTPGTSYQNTVASLLSTIVSSAAVATFNNFTLPAAAASDGTTLYGLFQCRGDLTGAACSGCISRAAAQLSSLCDSSCGGMIQLDGCFVRYDSTVFAGVEDKAVAFKRCGPQLGFADSDALTRRDALLSYVETWTQTNGNSSGAYRAVSSGEIKAVAQCVEDLSPRDCQDCLTESIGRLKDECRAATSSGDMFLTSCYVRYSNGGDQSSTGHGSCDNENEFDKTLAILLGLAAGVTLLIVFISYITKACNDHAKGEAK